eukprot:m.60127 g.60127  ORF g.60127 m.60127 type:complete len:556 (+) comp13056_c0_seq1:115-1782(+)
MASSSDDDDNTDLAKELMNLKGSKRRRSADTRNLDEGQSSDSDSDEYIPNQSKKKSKTTRTKSPRKSAVVPSTDESSSDDDDGVFTHKYDETTLLGDDQDQAYMESLTEKQREEIFTKRYEEREQAKRHWEIEQKLKQEKRSLKRQEKKKDQGETEGGRRRGANKTAAKKAQALEQLRASKKKQKRERPPTSDEEDDDDQDSQDDRDEDYRDSGSELDDRYRDEDEEDEDPEDREPAQLADIETIRLSRHKLQLWCHAPFFKKTVVGCFARVGLGLNEQQENIYRMVRIVDVKEGKEYKTAGTKAEASTKTNLYLVVMAGKQRRPFRISVASNQKFGSNEFRKFKDLMDESDEDFPTVGEVKAKRRDIEEASNFKYDQEAVRHVVETKRKLGIAKFNPATRKELLERNIQTAILRGDEERVFELQQEKERVEQHGKEARKKRQGAQLEAYEEINRRNREKNKHKKDFKAKATFKPPGHVDGEEVEKDLFVRRKTMPTMKRAGKKTKTQADEVQAEAEAKPKAEEKTAAPAAAPSDPADNEPDLFALHDFDIDIDI